ncbi:BspA family leucine-rich repeat surface protein [Halobacteriovorax sp. RT-1-4]|uniref:BspA family leucine-rich repeat surface protein n=1 Tax=unclassified Halobacteriovorax TaxID=2639665 RepID=UPI00399B4414
MRNNSRLFKFSFIASAIFLVYYFSFSFNENQSVKSKEEINQEVTNKSKLSLKNEQKNQSYPFKDISQSSQDEFKKEQDRNVASTLVAEQYNEEENVGYYSIGQKQGGYSSALSSDPVKKVSSSDERFFETPPQDFDSPSFAPSNKNKEEKELGIKVTSVFNPSEDSEADSSEESSSNSSGSSNTFIGRVNLTLSTNSISNLNISGGASPGPSETLTLKNSGTVKSAALMAPVIVGADAEHIEVINDNCEGVVLAPNDTCTFDIRPVASNNGSYSVSMYTSDSKESSDIATVSGTLSGFVPPVVDVIADQGPIAEGSPIATIDAGDGGDDFDSGGEPLTYTCTYDMIADGNVNSGIDCTTIAGVSLNPSSGVFDWTPNYFQSGSYEFMVVASDGNLVDDEIFVINVANNNRAPVIDSIANLTVNENSAMTTIDVADGGDDLDIDLEAITYSCEFDTVVDGSVSGTSCSTLSGFSLNSATGVINWTPSFIQAGGYEFKIIASDGSLSDEEIFTVTVNNVNRAPVLDPISDIIIAENSAITTINAGDGGDDFDIDLETITYSCSFDTTIDGSVTGADCSTLTGISFDINSGEFDWTPSYSQSGDYEFKITGTDGGLSDDEIFSIVVNDVNVAPVLDAISDIIVSENNGITTVDAGDGGDDLDFDLNTISYSCSFDTTIDGSVIGADCSTLTGVSFNSVTGELDWTPNFDQEGSYEFRITGGDGSLSDDEIFVVTVTNTNRAPVLDAIADFSVSENSAITTVDAGDGGDDSDIDLDTISYTCFYDTTVDGSVGVTSCLGLSGVSFNSTTGELNWTPDFTQSGLYEFRINGSDTSLSDDEVFVITVNNVNQPPVLDNISDFSVAENSAITTVNANDSGDDLDGDFEAISYSCLYDTIIDGTVSIGSNCTSLTGVSFNVATGELDWTPDYDQSGNYEFRIIGGDGTLDDDEIFVINVTNTNRAPVLDSIGDQTVAENSSITTVNAADGGDDLDVDLDTISYSCEYDTAINGSVSSGTDCSLLTGVSFVASTGVLNWTPDFSQAGTYEFKIVGSDGSLSDDEIFSITVNNVNRAPVLDSISNASVNENSALTTINAADGADDLDIDLDTITYSCTFDTTVDGSVAGANCSTLTGVTFNTSTGELDWTPNYSQAGSYEFQVNGSDGSLSDNEIFVVTVNNVNQPPVLDSISNQSIAENSVMTPINAGDGGDDLDNDSDTISYTCIYDTVVNGSVSGANCASLTGASFNGTTGVLNWTPNYDQSGSYEFQITGSDGSLSDSEIFSVTVTNTNRAPLLDSIADIVVSETSAMSSVNAADGGDDLDVDLDSISYTCTYDTVVDGAVASATSCTSLSGVSFSATTGVMDWTPDYTQSGNYEFKIVASDGSLSDDEIFSVTVNNVNAPPVLDAIADQNSAIENTPITTVNASDGGDDLDLDGQALTYSCTYDINIDGSVSGSSCTSLTGVSFNTSTGVMDWTPDLTQDGEYEFRIIASDGSLTDNEIFAIVVADLPGPSYNETFASTGVTTWTQSVTDDGNWSVDPDTTPSSGTGPSSPTDGTYYAFIESSSNYNNTHVIESPVFNTVTDKYVIEFDWHMYGAAMGELNLEYSLDGGSTWEPSILWGQSGDQGNSWFSESINLCESFPGSTTTMVRFRGVTGSTYTSDMALDNIRLTAGHPCDIPPVISSVADQNSLISTATNPIPFTIGDADSTITCSGSVTGSSSNTTLLSNANIVIGGTAPNCTVTLTPNAGVKDTSVVTLALTDGNSTVYEIFNYQTVEQFDISPEVLSSLDIEPGEIGDESILTVTNNGTISTGTIQSPVITGDTSNFEVVVDNCTGISLGAGASCTISVRGVETAATTYTGSLTVSDGTYTTPAVSLSGKQINPFKTTWRTTAVNEVVTLPLVATYNYNFTVDWGDGTPVQTITSDTDANKAHTYASAGDYQVKIVGTFEGMDFLNGAYTNQHQLISVESLGEVGWVSLSRAFYNCNQLTTFVAGTASTGITSLEYTFMNNTSLTSVDMTGLDTSSVVTMSYMFNGATALTTLDLSGFNTSNVDSMTQVFSNMGSLTSLNISNFDTSNVLSFISMFQGVTNLTSLDLSHFDTSSALYMTAMFKDMRNLTSLNISNFNTASVTNMKEMFKYVQSLTTLNLSNFNTGNVTNMEGMFFHVDSLTTLDLSSFDTSKVTNMRDMFYWNTNMLSMNLSSFNTANVTTMERMFASNTLLSSLNVSNFDTTKVTTMKSMFSGLDTLTTLDLSSFNTANVTDMSYMFSSGISLTSLNISSFNTSKVRYMQYLFSNLNSLPSLSVAHFDTALVENMDRMFSGMSTITTLDLSMLDTSNVTNMTATFSNMTALTSLNLTGFETNSVTRMERMFDGTSSLATLDLTSFDTSLVTTMTYMFSGMDSLTSLDISTFDTSSVTNFAYMFRDTILSVIDLTHFNTSSATSFVGMFYFANGVSSINMAGLNTSSVTSMTWMFRYADVLAVNATGWDLTSVASSTDMWTSSNAFLVLTCDQGGSPGTGDIFGEPCN